MTTAQTNNELASVWRNRNFVLLFIGKFISSVGDHLYLLAIPWLAMELTGSSVVLSLVMAVEYIARLISTFVAGAVADRFDRRKIMLWTTILQAVFVAMIPLLLDSGHFEVWMIYLFALVLVVIGGFYFNAEQAILPMMFSKELYTAMNSQFQMANTISRLVGPVVAGSLIGLIGVVNVLYLDVATFLLLTVAVFFMKMKAAPNKKAGESFGQSVKAGFVFLKNSPALIKVAMGSLFLNVALGPVLALLVFFATNNLKASSAEVGLIYSAGGLGGVLMSLLAPKLKKSMSQALMFLYNTVLLGIGILLLAFSSNWLMAAVSFTVIMSMVIWYNINYYTLIQELTPDEYRGRVGSSLLLISYISLPMAMSAAGILAEYLNIVWIFGALGAMMVVIGLYFYKAVYSKIDWEAPLGKQNTQGGTV